MAKTIEQIQQLITERALDERQIINLMMDYLQYNFGEGATAAISSSTTLQESIDSGAILDKDNDILTGSARLKIIAGTPDYSGVTAEVKVQNSGVFLYSQNADSSVYLNLVISHTNGAVTVDTAAGTFKLALEQAGVSDTFTSQNGKTITVVNGIITSIV